MLFVTYETSIWLFKYRLITMFYVFMVLFLALLHRYYIDNYSKMLLLTMKQRPHQTRKNKYRNMIMSERVSLLAVCLQRMSFILDLSSCVSKHPACRGVFDQH